MIVHGFPPGGRAGVHRILRFIKYLPSYGWNPIVLTTKETYWRKRNMELNSCLLEKVPKCTRINRVSEIDLWYYVNRGLRHNRNSENPSIFIKQPFGENSMRRLKSFIRSLISIPDQHTVGWLLPSVFRGICIAMSEKIDVLYATGPCWTSLFIGVLLKLITKKPLVLDIRDPWTENHYFGYEHPWRKEVDRFLERKFYSVADIIVTVTGPWKELLKRMRVRDIGHKLRVIPHGVDFEDFVHFVPSLPNNFVITHCGSLYEGEDDIDPFFQAIAELIKEGLIAEEALDVNMLGSIEKYTQDCVHRYQLDKVVHHLGFVPYFEAIKHQVNSSILLLILKAASDLAVQGRCPVKLFEYLAAGRPILAIVPKGVAADLVRSTRAGALVEPQDVEGIKKQIYNFYVKYRKGNLKINTDLSAVRRRFDGEKLTGELARELNGLVVDN